MSDKKYKILTEFVSDLSSETKDVETYIFVKDNISKYNLGIDIISKALKDIVIEIKTNLFVLIKLRIIFNMLIKYMTCLN